MSHHMRVELSPSAVEYEFSLSPRWWAFPVCLAMIALGASFVLFGSGKLVMIGYLWLLLWIALAGFIGARWLLRQTIQITSEYLILPRSDWSTEMIDVPIRDVSVHMSTDVIRHGWPLSLSSRYWMTIMFVLDGNLEERAFAVRAFGQRQFFELEKAIRSKVNN